MFVAVHRPTEAKSMSIVLQVSFVWDEEEDKVRAASLAQARDLALRTEFIWKMIIRDPQSRISGAVYLFADRQKAEAWRAELLERRGPSIEARIFEVDEEASRLTRAPLCGGASSAATAGLPVDRLNASNDE
jgi:hypothetical protein